MKLKNTYWRGLEFDLGGALEFEMNQGHDPDQGQLETVQVELKVLISMMTRLIERLYKRGALGEEDILELLGHGWEVVHDSN